MKPEKKVPLNTIVLGATGFIGLNLVRELISQGMTVTCFARQASSDLPKGVRLILGDLDNPPNELLQLLPNSNIFHLASSSKPATQFASIEEQIQIDFAPTMRFVERSAGSGARWIYISSGGTVYGNPVSVPISEMASCNPLSSYGLMKLAVEHGIRLTADRSVIARVSNPYGPWQSPLLGQGLVATLIHRISQGMPITIWGNGQAIRDYIYIRDVTRALAALAKSELTGTFNIGSGEGNSTLQMIRKIEIALEKRALVHHEAARSIDVAANTLDCTKLREALGWQPQTTFEQGLKNAIDWQKTQRF